MNEEILSIVNEKDQVIGSKPRLDLKESDIFRISGLMLMDASGNFLLQKRSASKKNNPNKWAPAAAGHVRAGETYETAIIREAAEEINAKNLLNLTPSAKYFRENTAADGKLRRRFSRTFVATISSPATLSPDGEEVSEIRWVSPAALAEELANSPDAFVSNMPTILSDTLSFLASGSTDIIDYTGTAAKS
jgi:isopentenyldiphosphate isomerase